MLSKSRLRRLALRLLRPKPLIAALVAVLSLLWLLTTSRIEGGWSEATDRVVTHYVRPDENTILIFPRVLERHLANANGSGGAGGRRSELAPRRRHRLSCLVIVHSAVGNVQRRDLIRKTWMPHLKEARQEQSERGLPDVGDMAVIFLTGNPARDSTADPCCDHSAQSLARVRLYSEADAHGDILAEDFVDSYANLTVKTVMMLKFLDQFAAKLGIDYVLKADDDVYANLPMLAPAVSDANRRHFDRRLTAHPALRSSHSPTSKAAPPPKLILGSLYHQTEPIRWAFVFDQYRKWICPRWLYPEELFPEYMAGPGYLITADLLPCLYRAALSTPLLPLEDVYATGLLGDRCRANKIDSPYFASHVWYEPDWETGRLKPIVCPLANPRGFALVHVDATTKKMRYLEDYVWKGNASRTAVLDGLDSIFECKKRRKWWML